MNRPGTKCSQTVQGQYLHKLSGDKIKCFIKGHSMKFNFKFQLTFLGSCNYSFIFWRVLKLVGGAKIPWSASCRILATTTSFITWWTSKSQILNLIFTLYFWNHFCVFIVMVRRNLCKLLTNLFGHNVKHDDVNRPLRWPTNTFVYPWRSLTTMSHDQLTFIDVWIQLV